MQSIPCINSTLFMDFHLRALELIEFLSDCSLNRTHKVRMIHRRTDYTLEFDLIKISWIKNTKTVPCLQVWVWSMVCQHGGHSLEHVWPPHTHGNAGSFWPAAQQLWAFDLTKRRAKMYFTNMSQNKKNATKLLHLLLWSYAQQTLWFLAHF